MLGPEPPQQLDGFGQQLLGAVPRLAEVAVVLLVDASPCDQLDAAA